MKHFFPTAALVISGLASPTQADRIEMQSTWHTGDGRAVHTGLLSGEDFEQTGLDLVNDGLRLIDIETSVLNGSRGFAGLFVEGSGNNFFVVDRSRAGLRESMTELQDAGLRLSDFEVYDTPRGRRFAGVFTPGGGRRELLRPMSIEDFLGRKDLMRTRDMRLVDVEAVVINGQARFMGLYSSEAPPAVFSGFRPRREFLDLRDRMTSDGWELFDFERINNAQGNNVFYALWREGVGPSRLSRLRTAAEQLFLTGQMAENGMVPVDVELQRVVDQPGPVPPGSPEVPEPELPPNPEHISITAGSNTQQMVIDFREVDDRPQSIEVPRSWLESWLPRDATTVLFPDAHCGLNIRNADRIFWQVPGDDAFNSDVFRSGPVTGTQNLLGGIQLSGPIGACAGMDVPWVFHPPFVAQTQEIDTLPNMRLVVEGAAASLRFQAAQSRQEDVFTAAELFSSSLESELMSVLDQFDELAEEQGNIDNYCSMVGAFWTQVCLVSSGDCPLPRENLPSC